MSNTRQIIVKAGHKFHGPEGVIAIAKEDIKWGQPLKTALFRNFKGESINQRMPPPRWLIDQVREMDRAASEKK